MAPKRRSKYEPRKDEGRKIVVDQLCTIVLCVSKDPPETCACAHFLTFHKVGVKYKYIKLLFFYQVGNLGQFTDLM